MAVVVGAKTQAKRWFVCLENVSKKRGGAMEGKIFFVVYSVLLLLAVGYKRR